MTSDNLQADQTCHPGDNSAGVVETNYTHGGWLLMECPECQGRSKPTIATTKALTGCRCERTAHPGWVEVVG